VESNFKQRKVGLVAFGFGEPYDLESNRLIAACVTKVAQTKEIVSIYTDRDVALHLPPDEAVVKQLDSTLFPHTYRMAVFTVKQMKEEGVEELHAVAASCHLWRAVRDLRWAAVDHGVAVKLVPHPVTGSVYDSKATTWYTQTAWLWWPLEIMYRVASSLCPAVYKRWRS